MFEDEIREYEDIRDRKPPQGLRRFGGMENNL